MPRHGHDPAGARRIDGFYKRSVFLFGLVAIGVGIALLVETAVAGGGSRSTGYLLGVLFLALGVGRIFLLRRR
ncbi:MAG TPA: hypothetical protein VJQ07_04900 [Gaiellaceae bacterium]|nr:hypothetical protein [Gaiellaceae bacterium]